MPKPSGVQLVVTIICLIRLGGKKESNLFGGEQSQPLVED